MPKWLQWIVKNIVLHGALVTGCIIALASARWFLREQTEEPFIALVVAASGIVIALAAGVAIKYGIATNSDQTQIYDAKNKLQDVSDKERPAMLNRIRSQYVENVLDAALHKNLVHELTGKQATDNLRVKVKKREDVRFLDEIDIVLMFEEANGRLLITGEPGGGKTTTLNQLAEALIDEAEHDPAKPIPVIFNLSEWANDRKSIEDWMIDVLKDKHNVNIEGLAEYWVQEQHILPLLDGLDEVTNISDSRRKCLQAIRDYCKTAPSIQLVICCRKNEWDDLKQNKDDLPELDEAIEIQPLTDAQIHEFLDKVENHGTPVAHIRKVLASDDPNWHELASIPLMLNVMIFAYADASPDEPIADKPLDELRKDIFDRYIERRFAPPANDRLTEQRNDYEKRLFKGDLDLAKRESVKWLSWLAWQMDERDIEEFYIESLQIWWLSNIESIKSYQNLIRIIIGLVFGLFSFLVINQTYWDSWRIPLPDVYLWDDILSIMITTSTLYLIFHVSQLEKIKPTKALKWNINKKTIYSICISVIVFLLFTFLPNINISNFF